MGGAEVGGGSVRRLIATAPVKVRLKPQGRELDVSNVKRVSDLLDQLSIVPGTVLVIRGRRLLTEDARLEPEDEIELRSVVSGG